MSIKWVKSHDQDKYQNYVIPEVMITANDAQLTNLRKKMLANYYQKQIRQKNHDEVIGRRQGSLATPRTTSQNPESSRVATQNSINYYQINQIQRDKQRAMKIQLALQYQRQARRKQEQKQFEKQIRQRENIIRNQHLKKMSDIENQKLRSIYLQEKSTMNQYLSQAEQQRKQKIQNKKKQQQLFNQRYAAMNEAPSQMPRSLSIGSMNEYSSPKLTQFRKHYDHVSQIQQQISENYLDKWGPIIRKKEQQKQKLINYGSELSKNPISSPLKYFSPQSHALNRDLKQALLAQILLKQNEKQQQQQILKSQQYTSKNYQKVYHPINNPIDFKITHDNKYVLRELKEEQEALQRQRASGASSDTPHRNSPSKANNIKQQENESGMTGLARNGSYVLLSK